MQVDQDGLRRKNEEILNALREKTRKHLQTQELYDKLKRRAMLGQVQDAASDAVDHTIQASVAANHFVDRVGNQNMRPPPPPPLFSGQQNNGVQRTDAGPLNGLNATAQGGRGTHEQAGWAGFSNQGSARKSNAFFYCVLYT